MCLEGGADGFALTLKLGYGEERPVEAHSMGFGLSVWKEEIATSCGRMTTGGAGFGGAVRDSVLDIHTFRDLGRVDTYPLDFGSAVKARGWQCFLSKKL